MGRGDWWCLGSFMSACLGKVLFETPPSSIEAHGEDVLSRPKAPQEVGSEPVFIVQHLEGEKCGNEPSACNIKAVSPDEDASQLSPFFQPAPPAPKEEIPPISSGRHVDGEDVQGAQGVFILRPQIVHLMSQFIRHRFPEEGS